MDQYKSICYKSSQKSLFQSKPALIHVNMKKLRINCVFHIIVAISKALKPLYGITAIFYHCYIINVNNHKDDLFTLRQTFI